MTLVGSQESFSTISPLLIWDKLSLFLDLSKHQIHLLREAFSDTISHLKLSLFLSLTITYLYAYVLNA